MLITYFSVFVLFVSETKTICNTRYYENSFPIIGTKEKFEFYPWNNFKNIDTTLKFLTIRKGNVKHICKNNLPEGVKEVALLEVGLEYIEPGFFEDSVQQVIIQGNNLTTITHGVFNGTKIRSLVLNDNQIELIEPYAFEDMVFLEAVALDDNKIQNWDSSWFNKDKVLYEISFRHNLLENLPQFATKNIIDAHDKFSVYTLYGNINFDNNNIKHIHPDAFSNLKYFGTISLSNNKLLELPDEVFKGFKFLFRLYLNTNNFICFSNTTVHSFKAVKNLYVARNKLNQDCIDRLTDYFSSKNDLVYL